MTFACESAKKCRSEKLQWRGKKLKETICDFGSNCEKRVGDYFDFHRDSLSFHLSGALFSYVLYT